MRRRQFLESTLKAGGALLGAGALTLAGAVAAVQPRRTALPLPAGDGARRRYPSAPRRVVVVGGGLAGLVAATELAARRFDVTLVEQAAALGGKLTAWTVRALGQDFPVEHGFHGFFAQYYNLREVLAAAGVAADLAPSPGYPVLFADRAPEMFGQTTRFFPFNMLSVVRQSRALHLEDFRHDGDGLIELMRYDGERTFARFDGVDFATFAREGRINRPMMETVLEPFGKTTLNALHRLSAAEAIRFFHFYFMGNPEGLGFSYLKRDSMAAVVDPLRRRLEAQGGVVRTGTAARRLVRDGTRVSRVVVDARGPQSPPLTIPSADVPDGAFRALPVADGRSVFVRRRAGAVEALDGRCTHMGCPVALAEGGGFRCPCHGGTFDDDGRPTGGPPKAPLAWLNVTEGEGRVVVGGGPALTEEALPCDYAVLACEVRGLQAVLSASDHLGDAAWRRCVQSLGEADPYVVWRLWLDRPTAPGRLPFYTIARFRYADSLALYSTFQEPFVSWARRTGGSVVEIHAYAVVEGAALRPGALRARLWEELTALLPELVGARVLHEELQQQSNFSRWAPGDHALRPTTTTPFENLVLAGDHVRLAAPAALMEAAAMSGRLAANAVLAAEGLGQVTVPTVALAGPLA